MIRDDPGVCEVCDDEPITDCSVDVRRLEVGTPCAGSFACNGACSDNFPVGDGQCEFGCDRFSCVDGELLQTESRRVDPCIGIEAGDAGFASDGGV